MYSKLVIVFSSFIRFLFIMELSAVNYLLLTVIMKVFAQGESDSRGSQVLM